MKLDNLNIQKVWKVNKIYDDMTNDVEINKYNFDNYVYYFFSNKMFFDVPIHLYNMYNYTQNFSRYVYWRNIYNILLIFLILCFFIIIIKKLILNNKIDMSKIHHHKFFAKL